MPFYAHLLNLIIISKKRIGEHLGSYHSGGRLPKTFKIIPSLTNWDEILLLTKPLLWTPQATFEATKVFLTNIKATQIKQYVIFILTVKFIILMT